jgi:hypothetical protein
MATTAQTTTQTTSATTTSTTSALSAITEKGPLLWKEIHLRALKWKSGDDTMYLRRITHRLRAISSSCDCVGFYAKWLEDNPPEFGKNFNYFKYTVRLHNAVNKKLGKPTITFATAKKYWSGGLE